MRRGRPRHDDILTPREWQVLRLIREGLTNEQIAERLGISLSAAKYHVSEIFSRLDASSRGEAVEKAEQHKRGLWGIASLGWLTYKRPANPALLTVALAAAAAIGLAPFLIAPWRGAQGGDLPSASDAQAGPDIGDQALADYERARLTSPYQHTVLLAASLPSNLNAEDTAVIVSLPRVGTLRQLQAVLTGEINLIVVDASAADEVRDLGFLYRQLQAGRAVLEVNLCLDEVHYRGLVYPEPTPVAGEVTEIAPDGTVRTFRRDPNQRQSSMCDLPLASGAVPFFAFRRLAMQGENGFFTPAPGGSNSVVNLSRPGALLEHVVSRLNAAAEGDPLSISCEEAKVAGVEEYFCPHSPHSPSP